MSYIKTPIGVKTHSIGAMGYLHFWYANNKRNGNKNVTVIWSLEAHRAPTSKQQAKQVSKTKTCGWKGHVNLSKQVCNELGL